MILNQAWNNAPGSLRRGVCAEDLRCLYLGSRFGTDTAANMVTF